jgi:List-Bact-rpt repeat protein
MRLLATLAWHAQVIVSNRFSRPGFVLTLVGSAVVAAGMASAAQLTLTWVDNAGGTASFSVERKTVSSGFTGTYAQIGTTAMGVTTYVDSAVVAATTYCYRVMAFNTDGNSDYSNEACGSLAAGFTVTVATAGSGTVVSNPAGITCPGTCVQSFRTGTVLTLTAIPAPGSYFRGWSGGGCSGTAPCVLIGNTPVTVTATFP